MYIGIHNFTFTNTLYLHTFGSQKLCEPLENNSIQWFGMTIKGNLNGNWVYRHNVKNML